MAREAAAWWAGADARTFEVSIAARAEPDRGTVFPVDHPAPRGPGFRCLIQVQGQVPAASQAWKFWSEGRRKGCGTLGEGRANRSVPDQPGALGNCRGQGPRRISGRADRAGGPSGWGYRR